MRNIQYSRLFKMTRKLILFSDIREFLTGKGIVGKMDPDVNCPNNIYPSSPLFPRRHKLSFPLTMASPLVTNICNIGFSLESILQTWFHSLKISLPT